MATSVSNVYLHVVEDVVNNLRADFQSEGVDDSVLNELQALWELKMMQTGAIQGPIERTANSAPRGTNAPITPVHDLNVPYEATEEYETPTAEMLFPPTPLQTPMQTPLPGIVEPVMYQYLPPGPSEYSGMPDSGIGGDVKMGRPAPYMQQPSPWMNQRPLGVDVNIAYEEGRDEDEAGITQPPMTKDFFTLSAGKRKREEYTSNYLPGGYIPQQDGAGDFSLELAGSKEAMLEAGLSKRLDDKNLKDRSGAQESIEADLVIAAIIEAKHNNLKIPQLDGVDDNSDDVDTNEDYNEPTEQDAQATNDAATPKTAKTEVTEDDEPPLNEDDDDDLDDLDQGDDEPNTSHLVLAQFEKVTRTKSRWKCILKDGIMHLNNKDNLFAKATGEFEF